MSAITIGALLLRNPKFLQLEPEVQKIVLNRVQTGFAQLEPEVQSIVMQRMSGAGQEAQIGAIPPTTPEIGPVSSANDLLQRYLPTLDVKGLVSDPSFASLPVEQRRDMILQFQQPLQQREYEQTKSGTGIIASALPTILSMAPTSLATVPPLVSTAARVGSPLGKRAATAIAKGEAFSPLAESVGRSGVAIRDAVIKAVEASPRAITKVAKATIKVPYAALKGATNKMQIATQAVGKKSLLKAFSIGSKVPEELQALIESEIIQFLVGSAVLASVGYGVKAVKRLANKEESISPITGRGIPGSETEPLE